MIIAERCWFPDKLDEYAYNGESYDEITYPSSSCNARRAIDQDVGTKDNQRKSGNQYEYLNDHTTAQI